MTTTFKPAVMSPSEMLGEVMPDSKSKASLQEIFSSIQGEGIYVGKRQIFVRFNGCHLSCIYCDTPAKRADAPCQIEPVSGSGQQELIPNPVPLPTVLEWIAWFHRRHTHHSISFTGGEPLLYTEFLKALLPQVSAWLPIYMETSGTQPNKLLEVLPWIHTVAMDIKLTSATQEPFMFEQHRAFYQIAKSKNAFIKLVFANETSVEEIQPVFQIVPDRHVPVILQPVTDLETGETTVTAQKMFELLDALEKYYTDVRIIPQTHKMLVVS